MQKAGLQPSSASAGAVHLDCQLDSHLTALNFDRWHGFCVLGHWLTLTYWGANCRARDNADASVWKKNFQLHPGSPGPLVQMDFGESSFLGIKVLKLVWICLDMLVPTISTVIFSLFYKVSSYHEGAGSRETFSPIFWWLSWRKPSSTIETKCCITNTCWQFMDDA